MKTSNKIIAEFMGVKESQYKNEYEMYSVIECIEDGENEKHFFKPDEMLFNSDWNWLMEVVEKILKDFYKLNPCPIYLKMNIEKALNEVNIDATYNSCVEFIKWYNENSAKEK